MKHHTVAIYARVSTDDKGQDPENQLCDLRAWCASGGHEIVTEYVEHVSGRKRVEERPEMNRLFADASKRKFTLVLFWSLDRFSREGMTQTVLNLERLNSNGVAFHSYTEEYLTTDNELVRDILLSALSSLAKVEAQKISRRTKAGMAKAKANGKVLGRPKITDAQITAIRETAQKNPKLSQRAIAKAVGVSRASVARHFKIV